jgi:histidinol-phosphate aminotransferase
VLDFSVCINPFMPPPNVGEALPDIPLGRYPDSEAGELGRRLAENQGVSADNILVGSGTTELIRLIALAYFRPGDPVLILEPTYGEYEVASRIMGADVIKQWVQTGDDFAPRIKETVALIREHRPRAVFLCNPNNPTGKYLARREIERILAAIEDGLLVLDEAYLAFVDRSWASPELISGGNLVILRSMTKDYGLAGLRLGYSLASREITDVLRRVRPPWNVNAVAQKVGIMVLQEVRYLEQTKQKTKEAKQFLVEGLIKLGLHLLPSEANYFLTKVGDAREFRAVLLRKGIQVRDCASFGLPEYIRIAPRTLAECQSFITTISELKDKGELDPNAFHR